MGGISEAVGQRHQVEAGAADDDGNLALPAQLRDLCGSVLRPGAGVVARGGVDMAEQVVGSCSFLLGVGASREDIEIGVALHGVGVDDLAVETLREGDGELRLAAGRRAVDQDRRSHSVGQFPNSGGSLFTRTQRLLERVARPNATRL